MDFLPQVAGTSLINVIAENQNIVSALFPEEYVDVANEAVEALSVVQDYLKEPLNGQHDANMQKLVAAAIQIADEKGVLPFKLDDTNSQTIASVAGIALDHIKTAYQIGTGLLDVNEAADMLVDQAAARVSVALDSVVEIGLPILAEKVCYAVATVFPPAAAIAPVAGAYAKMLVPKAKEFVRQGVKIVSVAAKTFARSAIEKVKETGRKVISRLFSIA